MNFKNKLRGNYDAHICYTLLIWVLVDSSKPKGTVIPLIIFATILFIFIKLNSL